MIIYYYEYGNEDILSGLIKLENIEEGLYKLTFEQTTFDLNYCKNIEIKSGNIINSKIVDCYLDGFPTMEQRIITIVFKPILNYPPEKYFNIVYT
jgi:hypothetical protein